MATEVASGTIKFPVICEDAEINTEARRSPEPLTALRLHHLTYRSLQILNRLLENDRLVLVANKPDLSELLTGNDRPIDGVNSPFTAHMPDGLQPMYDFMAAAKGKDGVSSKAFAVLDQQTAKDGKTCQVTTHDDDSDEENYQERVVFRCELSSAFTALEILDRGLGEENDDYRHNTARSLRNEASIAGGVWSREASDSQHASVSRISLNEYPRSSDWDEFSGTQKAEDPRPYVPVFLTAGMSLETLNLFTQEAYLALPETDPEIAPYTMAFVTSLKHPFHEGPAEKDRHLSSMPVLPSVLSGASPEECDILTRHLFPPQDRSELNYNRLIVMDELTEKTKTVLLACNCEIDGKLQLLRSDFGNALLAILAPENTILTMDDMASEAAKMGDGVSRM